MPMLLILTFVLRLGTGRVAGKRQAEFFVLLYFSLSQRVTMKTPLSGFVLYSLTDFIFLSF